MPLTFNQGRDRTLCCLVCLTANLFFSSVATAQSTGNGVGDTTGTSQRTHYFSCTVLTGGAVQFFRKRTGLFSVGFPYSAVDGSGATTTGTFSAEQRNVFGSASAFVGPLAFEAGWRHDLSILNSLSCSEKGFLHPVGRASSVMAGSAIPAVMRSNSP
jgi:hypothetical protein